MVNHIIASACPSVNRKFTSPPPPRVSDLERAATMSQPSSSRLSPLLRRRGSKASIAASDTTYHSFHDLDMELREPESPPQPGNRAALDAGGVSDPSSSASSMPSSADMRRQDSGYESLPPRTSHSHSRRRRTSTASAGSRSNANAAGSKPSRSRPSVRRSAKSASQAHQLPRGSGQSLYLTRSHNYHNHHRQNLPQPPPAFFQFPSPDPSDVALATRRPSDVNDHGHDHHYDDLDLVAPPTPGMPPQTTHYWTSDRTRRLEYAAIDAASRGVKGWFMRHLVPDCFVARESRLVGFDDDGGSVRRYRLDLDEDAEEGPGAEKAGSSGDGRKGWPWSRKADASETY